MRRSLSPSSFQSETLTFTCNLTLTYIRLTLWSIGLVLILAGTSVLDVGPSVCPRAYGFLLLVPIPFLVTSILLLVPTIFLITSILLLVPFILLLVPFSCRCCLRGSRGESRVNVALVTCNRVVNLTVSPGRRVVVAFTVRIPVW